MTEYMVKVNEVTDDMEKNIAHGKNVLSAYITNLGKYTEGSIVGEWVQFPITAEELEKVYARIGINSEYEEIFITDYETGIHNLELGEYESLDELNYLACRIKELNEYEKEKFDAIIESGIDLRENGLEAYINLTYNLDIYDVISDINDNYDLGVYYAKNLYDLENMGELANYIDYEALGRDKSINEGGCFAKGKYVLDTQEKYDKYYDRESKIIPEEYRITKNISDRESQIEKEKPKKVRRKAR